MPLPTAYRAEFFKASFAPFSTIGVIRLSSPRAWVAKDGVGPSICRRDAGSVWQHDPIVVLHDQPGAPPLAALHRALERADRGPPLAADLSVLSAVSRGAGYRYLRSQGAIGGLSGRNRCISSKVSIAPSQ